MELCQCDKPQPWESNVGAKTNMCKACGGKIEKTGTSERGRFITATEKAVADLKLPKEVQEELWAVLHSSVSAWVRHRYKAAELSAHHRRLQEGSVKAT